MKFTHDGREYDVEHIISDLTSMAMTYEDHRTKTLFAAAALIERHERVCEALVKSKGACAILGDGARPDSMQWVHVYNQANAALRNEEAKP